jgi:hypothetical protein
MKSPIKVFDAFQIIGFIISVAISIGLIVMKQDTVASVTLGLILATLTQLFDLQIRHSATEERILKASAISESLYKDEPLLEDIQQIVEDYQSVKKNRFDRFELFQLQADAAIDKCRNTLHSMSNGFVLVDRDSPYSLGAEAFHMAKQSLKVVTTMDISQWRENPRSQKYIEAYTATVQRGIDVKRIFVQPVDRIPEILDILEEQRSTGMNVYIVRAEDLSREFNEDFLLMDDRILSKMEFTGHGYIRIERLSVDTTEISQMLERFDLLLRYAKTLETVLKDLRA